MAAEHLRLIDPAAAPSRASTRTVHEWLVVHSTDGMWRGPQEQIALGTQLNVKTVGRSIASLRQVGFIKTEPDPGTRGSLIYYIEAMPPAPVEPRAPQTSGSPEPRTEPQTSEAGAPGPTLSSWSSASPRFPTSGRGDSPEVTSEVAPIRQGWRGVPLPRLLHEAVGEETPENLHDLASLNDEQIEWVLRKARRRREALGEIPPAYFTRICNSARKRFGPDLARVPGLDELLDELDGAPLPHEAPPDDGTSGRLPDRSVTTPPSATGLLKAAGRQMLRNAGRALADWAGGE